MTIDYNTMIELDIHSIQLCNFKIGLPIGTLMFKIEQGMIVESGLKPRSTISHTLYANSFQEAEEEIIARCKMIRAMGDILALNKST